jgi:hypothetical protein
LSLAVAVVVQQVAVVVQVVFVVLLLLQLPHLLP